MKYDALIIGGGHNGLVTACYLAKAGFKTLVLERRPVVGGGAITEEIQPGYRWPTLEHTLGPISPRVVADLNLKRNGLELINPAVRVLSLDPDGRSLCIFDDVQRTQTEIEKYSTADAQKYPDFVNSFSRIGRVLSPLLSMTPPLIDKPDKTDLWHLGKVGLAFRKLGKKDEYRLLRWGPMAVADLVGEWFETELLQATVAARGIYGAFAGPWSAGTSLGLLWQAALDGQALAPSTTVKGGIGQLTQSLAKAAVGMGVEVRTNVEVVRIEPGSPVKVVVAGGDEFQARAVVSNADPRTTLLNLVDPIELDPNFLLKIRNYRAPGASAKINLALSALPKFSDLDGVDAHEKLSGRIHIGPDIDYLERAFDSAKYGDYSPRPYLDITIPSLVDSSLAPEGKHIMSVHVQFAPYQLKAGDWQTRCEEFGDSVIDLLQEYAPGLKSLIIARQIITPHDLEEVYGLSGGHIHHGEQTLDQSFTFRPLIGWAQYRTPLAGLYLCGAGTHPGGGVTAMPGANAAREIIADFKRKRL